MSLAQRVSPASARLAPSRSARFRQLSVCRTRSTAVRPMAAMGNGLLASKCCLVTGAGRGIGRAIAEAFAKEGAKLVLVARSEEQLKDTAAKCKELGASDAVYYPTDMSDAKQVDQLCAKVLQDHQRVDVLVNNAGGGPAGSSHPVEGDPDTWDKMMALNLSTPMRLTNRLAPKMVEAKSGLIINIGSVAGLEGMAGAAAYCASKHGLTGWSSSCYQALRPHNIKVVLICPGFVDTALVGNTSNLIREKMIKPSDIAEAAMLAVRCGPSAVPEQIVMRVCATPYPS